MLDLIQESLDDDCALTLVNLIAIVRDEFQVVVSISTMRRAIGKFRYSLKKFKTLQSQRMLLQMKHCD